MQEHSCAVYLITNTRRGVLYVGVTSNLASRITHHREGATGGFTRRYGCRYLVWFEIHTDIHALALYFAFYNFCRIHKALKITPAMAAGMTDRLWSLEDIAERIEARNERPTKRGPYKKRSI